MKLVVGLGNPGDHIRRTRHNVGFDVVDAVLARHRLAWQDKFAPGDAPALESRWRRLDGDVLFLRPLTFMNVSGQAVSGVARFYKVAAGDLLIVCDDVNLPVGRLRTRASGSEGGHNGLRSIADSLGTIEYARLRVGVGRGDTRRDLADHVLARFEPDEMPVIGAAIDRAGDAVETWIVDGLSKMMNTFNRVEDAT